MQTFLPYADFALSACVLDRARLGKQRIETKQIYRALIDPSYGWQHHPAVIMWRGCEVALLWYGRHICREWVSRGYRDMQTEWFDAEIAGRSIQNLPRWLGNERFHASHRSNLLRKYPEWYKHFQWEEPDNLPYLWPIPGTTVRFRTT